MSVRPLPYNFPAFAAELAKIKDTGTAQVLQRLVNDINTMLKNVSMVANFNFRLLDQLGGPFFAAVTNPVSMSVMVNAGFVWVPSGPTLTPVAAQTVGPFTAPTANQRIDRVVLLNSSGVASVITGTPGVSPTPPAISASHSPVCQVLLTAGMTQIQPNNLTDERALSALGV